MGSSRRKACFLSSTASFLFFLLIIFQVPLFRVPCGIEICRSPVEVTCSQLIASDLFPTSLVKALLYPGALAKGIVRHMSLPKYSNFLKSYSFTNARMRFLTISDVQHLEVLAGSYLCLVGAFASLIKPGRISLCGVLLLIWGLFREIIMGRNGTTVYMNQTILIALVLAFLSVRRDLRRIIRSRRVRYVAKPCN